MGTRSLKHMFAAVAVSALALAAAHGAASAGEIRVGLVTPLSGPIASQGIPFSKGMAAGQHLIPGVNGHTFKLIQLDDESNPSLSTRNARKLIDEDKVDVLVGTGGVPGAMALASIASESKLPLVSFTPLFLSGEKAAWSVTTAQPASLMIQAVVDTMKANGVKTVGYIGFSDSWGDLAYNTLMDEASKAGIEVVTNERYARSDTSVTGQALKIVAANPDAVLGGTAGTPGALPYIALADRGYQGAIYGTHGIINPDFIRVAGGTAEGLLAPTGPAVVADQLPDSHPSKAVAGEFKAAYQEANGEEAKDAFSAYAFDAWKVIADAASRVDPSIEPGTPAYREALRDAIFQVSDLPVTHGVLTFRPGSPYGADDRAAVMVKLTGDQWVLQK
ncbi:branched-chain amino acid ABC transporter substrate-binding protein [Zhengella mangrovi]|uniref:Branched-chain amino acid ABC transporter substrate-binding protein n=2 Tax=Zhengella mangrovi TaxID=1982044 RepID=A0A2G1QGZ0_9HYPH|nr:branched-chain amino acid ABC transporter substrate-binding protein [Zhengella mangrovi]